MRKGLPIGSTLSYRGSSRRGATALARLGSFGGASVFILASTPPGSAPARCCIRHRVWHGALAQFWLRHVARKGLFCRVKHVGRAHALYMVLLKNTILRPPVLLLLLSRRFGGSLMLCGYLVRARGDHVGFLSIGTAVRRRGTRFVNIGTYSIVFGRLLRTLLGMLFRLAHVSLLSGQEGVLIGGNRVLCVSFLNTTFNLLISTGACMG